MAQAAIGANERAYLDTIRMAEGTWHGGGQKGYGTMFGGGQFDWSKGHPDQVVRSGGYASAAAGAYQFMPDTWKGVAGRLGLKDFSPESQDRAALQLIRDRGVDPSKPMTTEALAKLSPEWASLPTAAGKSYYGQPVKGQRELLGFYQGRLGAAPNPGNGTAAAGTASDGGSGGGGGGGGGGLPMPGAPASLLGSNTAGSVALSGLLATPLGTIKPNGLADYVQQSQAALLNSVNPMLRRPGSGTRMAGSPGRDFLAVMQKLIQPLEI
ncbi:MAG: glycoside hydrolase family 104 protein [Cyanobium sp. 49614_E6]|jgi:muramidase (phage lysozyme)|nr:glycoside hydrolase family 104 protein [Cyanobium sp. 49614_E6]